MDKRKVAPPIDPDVLAECGYHGPRARDFSDDERAIADLKRFALAVDAWARYEIGLRTADSAGSADIA